MKKILLSACLLGKPVRYDGRSRKLQQSELELLVSQGRVVEFCPEVAAGMGTPRAPAEIEAGDAAAVLAGKGRVQTATGTDVSFYFRRGAQLALALCREHDIQIAVLTETSPSCGSSQVYDGSFSRSAIPGEGITTRLLRQNGIRVYSQHQLLDAISDLRTECHYACRPSLSWNRDSRDCRDHPALKFDLLGLASVSEYRCDNSPGGSEWRPIRIRLAGLLIPF